MQRLPTRTFIKSNIPWLIILLATGLATRVPHLISYFSFSSETALTYFPTLASARFEQCAKALVDGTASGDAFSYASPLYILLLGPLYAVGITNLIVFLLQSITSVVSAFLMFTISLRLNSSRILALSGTVLWLFYAPAAFYEMTLLPVSLLTLLVLLWALQELNSNKNNAMSFKQGVVSGMVTGLRPPLIFLGVFSLLSFFKKKQYLQSLSMLTGLLIPLLILCVYHSTQRGSFSPFVSATGINLVLGHADGASGYGPPIAEYGLIENPAEDIHQVAAKVAAENGANSSSEANSFWLNKAITWIIDNPEGELKLLEIKLGGFLGYRPYGSYYDLDRDIENDHSLNHLIVPRYLLVAFIAIGIVPFLLFNKDNRILALPVLIAMAASLGFVHSERFWLPAVPVSLAISVSGLQHLINNPIARTKRIAVSILLTIVLMLPGLIWPVPQIPEGHYLYNRAAKAYNMRNYILALTLFEKAAEVSPQGTSTSVHARMEALRISQALNLDDRVRLHSQLLQLEIDEAGSVNFPPDSN